MKTIIDTRPVIANLITRFADTCKSENFTDILMDLSRIGDDTNKIEVKKLVEYFESKMVTADAEMKLVYADCIAYVDYISGKSVDKILNKKAIPLCQKRNLDICSMYCDGYDTSCEMYKSCETDDDVYIGTCSRFEEDDDTIAIEVCSFEEGDPQ